MRISTYKWNVAGQPTILEKSVGTGYNHQLKSSPFSFVQCWSGSCCEAVSYIPQHCLVGEGEGYSFHKGLTSMYKKVQIPAFKFRAPVAQWRGKIDSSVPTHFFYDCRYVRDCGNVYVTCMQLSGFLLFLSLQYYRPMRMGYYTDKIKKKYDFGLHDVLRCFKHTLLKAITIPN